MVEITIVCLIYKSRQLAKAVYESLYAHTPKLRNGEADLLFVANDPTAELVDFLKSEKYPFIVNVNDHLTDKELFALGYGAPEYMRRVYQGYNQGILNAKGKKVVLINSDNFFSDDWLENLLKYSDYKKVVVSTLIEPGQGEHGVFPGAIQKNFGRTLENYKDNDFQDFAAKIAKTGYNSGGVYMPCLLYKDIAIIAGLYPEGNIANKSFNDIKQYGDESFYASLRAFGVEHISARDSIVYHLKEGELSESIADKKIINDPKYKRPGITSVHKVHPNNLMCYIRPEAGHQEVMDLLGNKFSVIILKFDDSDDLEHQISRVKKQNNNNFDITVLYDETNKSAVIKRHKDVKYVLSNSTRKDIELYRLLHEAYGEYIIVPDTCCMDRDDIFDQSYSKDKIGYLGRNQPVENKVNDSIGNFIIPKRLILDDIGLFLGFFLNEKVISININQCIICYVDNLASDSGDGLPSWRRRISRMSSLPLRAIKRLYHDGPISFVMAVARRLRRKNE